MAHSRSWRIAHIACLLLILASPASAQFSRFLRGSWYIDKGTDTMQVVKFSLNAARMDAHIDSIAGGKDTIIVGPAKWTEIVAADTGYVTFFDARGYGTRASQVSSAAMSVITTTGDWRLVKMAIRHSYWTGPQASRELTRDTVATVSYARDIPRGSTITVAYTPAQSFGQVSPWPSSGNHVQEVVAVYTDRNSETFTDLCASGVSLPLYLDYAQIGLRADHFITVSLMFVHR